MEIMYCCVFHDLWKWSNIFSTRRKYSTDAWENIQKRTTKATNRILNTSTALKCIGNIDSYLIRNSILVAQTTQTTQTKTPYKEITRFSAFNNLLLLRAKIGQWNFFSTSLQPITFQRSLRFSCSDLSHDWMTVKFLKQYKLLELCIRDEKNVIL